MSKLLDDIVELYNYCGRKCEVTHPQNMSCHETMEDYYFNKGRYRAYRDIFDELWEIILNNKEELIMPGCTSNCNNCPVFICAYNKTPGQDHVKQNKEKEGKKGDKK